MIVRVFNDGQYEVADELLPRLQELDRGVETALQAGDEAAFRAAYDVLLALVRTEGTRLGDDDLRPSELMLPPADTSLEEAGREFSAQGLIPD